MSYNEPLARYVKLRIAHAPGMPETLFPPPRVSDTDIMPWCMPGSLTSGFLWSRWPGKRSRHSRRMRDPASYVSGKMPIILVLDWWHYIAVMKDNTVGFRITTVTNKSIRSLVHASLCFIVHGKDRLYPFTSRLFLWRRVNNTIVLVSLKQLWLKDTDRYIKWTHRSR